MTGMGAYALCFVTGYLLGCLSPSWALARLRGKDIKAVGNGNAGASNTAMSLGVGYGVLVAVIDIMKGAGAVLVARYLICPEDCAALAVAGGAAVLGHAFPFWMKFRGGKGFAAYLGMTAALDWRLCLALAAVGLVLAFATDRIVAMTFTFAAGCPAGLWLSGLTGCCLAAFTASVLMVVLHRRNIVNLAHGTEPGIRSVLKKDRRAP